MVTAAATPRTRAGENYLTEAEEKKLFSMLKNRKDRMAERDYALLKLVRATGLRRIEALRLNVSDVRAEDKSIKDSITVDERIAAKGGIGSVYLSVEIREDLKQLLLRKKRWGEDCSDDAPLFVSKKGGRLSKRQFNQLVDKWCLEAKIPRYTPHALRHTKAHRIMDDQHDDRQNGLVLANKWLRHKSFNATLIYTAPSKEDMQRVAGV